MEEHQEYAKEPGVALEPLLVKSLEFDKLAEMLLRHNHLSPNRLRDANKHYPSLQQQHFN